MILDETKLQGHLIDALKGYAQSVGVGYSGRYFSNPQQNINPAGFFADFCFTLNQCSFYAIELKVLISNTGKLKSPNQMQMRINKILERYGLPVFYMYNVLDTITGMSGYSKPLGWEKKTLNEVNYCSPSVFSSSSKVYDTPNISSHDPAIDLFSGNNNKNPLQVGAILKLLNEGYFESNRILAIIYVNGSQLKNNLLGRPSSIKTDVINGEIAGELLSVLKKANHQNSDEFNKLSDEERKVIKDVLAGASRVEDYISKKKSPKPKKPDQDVLNDKTPDDQDELNYKTPRRKKP
ncbi:hypothetical protein [Yersinia intermedia]|uniref:hypothetical protein n=1 Tax=Yersinia intermedia TaxID=631 RepID=UPI00065D82C2|nr:hypothetical protein [Yersinia intermedia]CRY84139.1 Uncharacterised protein [Yersinia intermedia]